MAIEKHVLDQLLSERILSAELDDMTSRQKLPKAPSIAQRLIEEDGADRKFIR